MDVVEVEGESISPEDFSREAGWITSHHRKRVKALEKLSQSLEQDDAGLPKSSGVKGQMTIAQHQRGRSSSSRRRQQRAPRVRDLPKEDVKIVLRPRDGLDLARCSQALLKDGVLRAANFKAEEVDEDTLRVNTLRNIVVVSTPSLERAPRLQQTQRRATGLQIALETGTTTKRLHLERRTGKKRQQRGKTGAARQGTELEQDQGSADSGGILGRNQGKLGERGLST
ncbi:hypothetical protein HPB48_020410 [Haemaphysalis longicornis]|uniref:Uncharacterized protein n=1 Tax=Haemaphysalis longicornis TaxID=44386 RepID=A0A9J6GU24_HAELO|nr:hypothetical protein HPB48_020410 [Haemaphysalis longicornis]